MLPRTDPVLVGLVQAQRHEIHLSRSWPDRFNVPSGIFPKLHLPLGSQRQDKNVRPKGVLVPPDIVGRVLKAVAVYVVYLDVKVLFYAKAQVVQQGQSGILSDFSFGFVGSLEGIGMLIQGLTVELRFCLPWKNVAVECSKGRVAF